MTLESVRGWMSGEHCLVVAPGPSSLAVPRERYTGHWTIGCNRAVAYCDPDFAVCREPMRDSCWPVIEAAAPMFVFCHEGVVSRYPRAIGIPKDVRPWLQGSGDPLKASMSPFNGAAVALHLGFSRIGLVGVDLNDSQRFRTDEQREAAAWGELLGIAEGKGVALVNLNRRSKLRTVPFGDWADMERR